MSARTATLSCSKSAPRILLCNFRQLGRGFLQASAFLVVALLATGCNPDLVQRQTPFMVNVGDIEMSSRELRVRVVEFGRHVAATVEQQADRIAAETDDPDVRRSAIRWKARAIPAAQEAVLQIDPLMSFVDIWAFTMQMERFFESGDGASWFGASQPAAIATAKQLLDDARALALRISISGDIEVHEAEIRRWADGHPIRDDLLLRDSVIGSGADLLGDQRGAFALVEDMNSTTREMAYRLAFYNEYLLKQVRWAIDLGGGTLMDSLDIDSTFSALRRTMALAESATDDIGAIAERERTALLEALSVERRILLAEIERQRLASFSSIAGERAIVLDALAAERVAAMESIAAEREAAIETLLQLFDEGKLESRAVVDHAMYRLAQILAVAGILALLVVIGLAVYLKRSLQA